MLGWIDAHSDTLQVVFSGLMALIWIVYLQLFFFGFRRNRRPKIVVDLGAGTGLGARCLVGNLGFEPIHVYEVFVTIAGDGESHTAAVTERAGLTEDELNDPLEATNRGPLKSGDSYTIGRIADLVERTRNHSGADLPDREVRKVEIMVVATTAASTAVVAAHRVYHLRWKGESCELWQDAVEAHQIRSLLQRHRLRRRLKARLWQARVET